MNTKLFLLAFLFSIIITPLVIVVAKALKINYYPNASTMHKKPIPLLGGVAIWLSFSLVLLFFSSYNADLICIFIAASTVFIVGLIDDVKRGGLSSYIRFSVGVVASIVVISRGIMISFLPNVWWGRILEFFVTIIWIVGVTNAYNLLDGLDGLACGSAAINCFFFFLIAAQTAQTVGYPPRVAGWRPRRWPDDR